MGQNQDVDMDILREFYDPHPGFAGAAIPIPGPIKQVADQLNGKRLSLNEAVAQLRAVGIGKIEVVGEYNFIFLLLDGGGNYLSHGFRVIKYR